MKTFEEIARAAETVRVTVGLAGRSVRVEALHEGKWWLLYGATIKDGGAGAVHAFDGGVRVEIGAAAPAASAIDEPVDLINDALAILMDRWPMLEQIARGRDPDKADNVGVTAAEVAKVLNATKDDEIDPFEEVREAVEVLAGRNPGALRIGNALRRFRGMAVNGRKFVVKDARWSTREVVW